MLLSRFLSKTAAAVQIPGYLSVVSGSLLLESDFGSAEAKRRQ